MQEDERKEEENGSREGEDGKREEEVGRREEEGSSAVAGKNKVLNDTCS